MTDDDVVEPILTHADAQNMYFNDSQSASPETARDSAHPDSLPQDSQPPVESQIPADSQPATPLDPEVKEPEPQDMPREDKQQQQTQQTSGEKPDNQETLNNPESGMTLREPPPSPRGVQVDVLDSDEEEGKKKKKKETSQESKAQKGTFKEHKHISSACQLLMKLLTYSIDPYNIRIYYI